MDDQEDYQRTAILENVQWTFGDPLNILVLHSCTPCSAISSCSSLDFHRGTASWYHFRKVLQKTSGTPLAMWSDRACAVALCDPVI